MVHIVFMAVDNLAGLANSTKIAVQGYCMAVCLGIHQLYILGSNSQPGQLLPRYGLGLGLGIIRHLHQFYIGRIVSIRYRIGPYAAGRHH